MSTYAGTGDFTAPTLHVRRVKAGTPSTHPLAGQRDCGLCAGCKREQEPPSPFVFVSERKVPFTTEGFARLLQRAAKAAGLTIKVHPHMLRHACGFKLANDGVDTRALQSLPRPQEHPAHGALHRAGADAVQEFLAGLSPGHWRSSLARFGRLRVHRVAAALTHRWPILAW